MNPFISLQMRLFTALCCAFLMTACGSSGSGNNKAPTEGTQPNAAVVSANITTKALNLSWPQVSNANDYHVYMDRDGNSGFTDVSGSLTGTSFSLPLAVHATDWQNARFMVEACNSAGCTPSIDTYIDGNVIDAIGYIKAATNDSNAVFGFGLAISADGSTLAVGAPKQDYNTDSGAESGAVFIFSAMDNVWAYETMISNPSTDLGAGDRFGYTVALSQDGSTLAIGAPFEDGSSTGATSGPLLYDLPDNNTAQDSGAAYVYVRENDAWALQSYFKASNTNTLDYFGLRVALANDGSRLAVGVPYESSNASGIDGDEADNSTKLAGAVYVFVQSDAALETPWIQEAYIKPSTASRKDLDCFSPLPPGIECTEISASRFGYGLAFANNGNTLAIGAPGNSSAIAGINGDETDIEAKSSGAVSILTFADNAWQHTAFIKASNPDIDDEFGYSLAFAADGNTLVVGAPYEDGNGSGLNSDTQSDNTEEDAGAAYTFSLSGGQWSQQDYIKATYTNDGDYFGWNIALSGDGATLAIGSPRDDSNALGVGATGGDGNAENAGAVYTYRLVSQAWQTLSYVKASNTNAGDTFGRTLALSYSGDTLAITASGEDSNAEGIGGDQSNNDSENAGAVYLY